MVGKRRKGSADSLVGVITAVVLMSCLDETLDSLRFYDPFWCSRVSPYFWSKICRTNCFEDMVLWMVFNLVMLNFCATMRLKICEMELSRMLA